MSRTIAAISTPMGVGGIAVIRLSGADAVEIADKVFSGKRKLSECETHTVHYGFIKNERGEKIDEVLATLMRAPKTFTREDVVEISTHGGYSVSRAALDALIRAGAYPAQAGEFTKRAFLNGRIDLTQAEAVIDIINSTNEAAQRNALSQLEGSLSKEIDGVRKKLVHLAAQMQVSIDYPDEDLEDITVSDIRAVSAECKNRIDRLLSTADSGKILRDGIRTVIVGKPNVGKSSLLNSLAREERAIVTDVAGTTRDTIEEYINLDGIPLILIDTAGIRKTDDAVERIGVERSRKSIEDADFVIVVIDGSSFFDDEDTEILRATKNKKRIVLINKTDLGQSKYAEAVRAKSAGSTVLEISAKTGIGLRELADEIRKIYNLGEIAKSDVSVITNMRHKTALIKAGEALERTVEALDMNMPQDIASIDINIAIDALGEITGETVSDDIVAEIFHNFCVGK
ncbi:MAG: tRNA uridine-5-carboxymethylaminomethyl(34) synthesis GTPase MnmE [Oscillospiraceae bacterium]|nr:tRNA uridine-5-carboxymethylaminomethyl(34) synthesis GTPase MnmE [Oscillospiraceae bacterium]